MLSKLRPTLRHTMSGTVAAVALLLATALSVTAQSAPGGPTEYRACWLGSPSHYDACVEANNWGATLVFPDRDGVSLVIDGIPSY
ncbi:MAG TPA: hypothetical protein VEX37_06410 [Thermomicrobiales bacterium]|nr:hypothetical protein [Thermomicrobiales bacterium]